MKKYLIYLWLILLPVKVFSQQILVDRAIMVENLWCFPIEGKPSNYRFLPNTGALAINDKNLPEFSFMRYVSESQKNENDTKSIQSANGGGILHFLSLYKTPEDNIKKAEQKLREILANPDIVLEGPVLFDNGSYQLVSSILQKDQTPEKILLNEGNAPLLENSKIPLSFELNPTNATLLLESFKMATPDVSVSFQLGFSGLTDSYDAELEVNWDQVKTKDFKKGGVSAFFVSTDVEKNIESLIDNKMVTLTVRGQNPNMEGLMRIVYDRLTDLLFKKAEPKEQKEIDENEPKTDIGKVVNDLVNIQKQRNFSGKFKYIKREIKQEGTVKINLTGQSTVQRYHIITFNLGNLYKKYAKNEQLFKDVSLNDNTFLQRDIHIGIDGSLEKEFDQMINGVTVMVRKKHEDGSETIKELLISRKKIEELNGAFSLSYLNQKDQDLEKWMHYEYKTTWQFVNGKSLSTEWASQSSAMINLDLPFKRQQIQFEGDWEVLKTAGVRAVNIRVSYPFFTENKTEQITFKSGEMLNSKRMEITLPDQISDVNYQLNWYMADGSRISSQKTDNADLIFIDELPKK